MLRRPLAVCTVAIFVTMPVTAQTSLKIPRDARDMQEIMRQSEGACSSCGVVTNVARVDAGDVQNPLETGNMPSGDPGPGTDIRTSPMFGSVSRFDSARKLEPGRWRIIVRYDDGSYASFEQLEKPVVAKGDRVQVKADRVEPH